MRRVVGRGQILDPRFLALSGICTTVFVALLLWVRAAHGRPLAFDGPVERIVLRIRWGPLQPVVDFVGWLAGPRQTIAGVLVVVVVGLAWRRVAPLMLAGALSGPVYQVISTAMARPRPPSLGGAFGGFSFPSGHAVFFTVYATLVALVITRRLRPIVGHVASGLLLVLWAVALVSRVWDHAHWASDVVAGAFLGLAWVSLVLSIRWLASPVVDAP